MFIVIYFSNMELPSRHKPCKQRRINVDATSLRRIDVGTVIISTFYLGEIANTNYKSNKELDSFSSFNIK